MNQRAGQCHTLLLPTGQRRRPLVGAIRQTDRFQRFQSLGTPVALEPEADVVDDLFPRQQTCFLEHQPGVFPRFAQRCRTGQQLTARRLIKPGQQAQQSTFATAAATDHGDELPRRNMQIDLAQHLPRTEGFLQFAHGQRNPAQQAWRLLSSHAAPPFTT
ncbi:hypothetical protein D3C72_605290 [compost metagenome]